MGDLTSNFDRSEFACKCGCGENRIDMVHVDMLQRVRSLSGVPMSINSGYRCTKHNRAIGGGPEHPKEKGSDVGCNDSHGRYLIIKAALEVGFHRIGISKSFIHFGSDPYSPQEVIWLY